MWKALIRLVEKWGCSHKWDKLGEMGTFVKGERQKGFDPIGIEWIMVCTECGKIKKIEL